MLKTVAETIQVPDFLEDSNLNLEKKVTQGQETTKKPGNPNWYPGMPCPYPAGRPKVGHTFKELLEVEGAKYSSVDTTMTRKEYLASKMFDHAERGNAMVMRELLQRMEPIASEQSVMVVFRDEVSRMGLDPVEVVRVFLQENRDVLTPELLQEFMSPHPQMIDSSIVSSEDNPLPYNVSDTSNLDRVAKVNPPPYRASDKPTHSRKQSKPAPSIAPTKHEPEY